MRMASWLVASIFYLGSLSAHPTVVPDPIACVKDLEVNFFQESIVNQGLSLYDIREELWIPINISLRGKSVRVPERMKRATAFMVPNPIEYPMQMGPTAKILKQVLFEVLMESLHEYLVNERPRSDHIFNYIFTQQLPLFVRCFGEVAKELEPSFD